MAWDRVCKVVIRTPGASASEYTETELTSLNLDFKVSRSRIFNDNDAQLTIYNAAKAFTSRILKRGSNVLIYAGYKDDGQGLVYQGNIIQVTSTNTGTDTITTVYAMSLRSLDKPFTSTPVVLNFPPAVTADRIVNEIGTRLGLVAIGEENARAVEFPQGWSFVGPVGLAIERLGRDLIDHGFGLYIDLAELVVYSTQSTSTYSVAYLSYQSGLLSIKDTTDYLSAARSRIDELGSTYKANPGKGGKIVISSDSSVGVYSEIEKAFTNMRKTLSAQTLMIPKIRPNSLVQVSAGDISGLFVVDRMTINGGNYSGSSFTMDLELLEA